MCARCHREKKNLRATLRSGGELAPWSDWILLLAACRQRARVKRACAVGIARRGAQIGRLGAPCKAGGHCWALTHECRCCRAPQFRAIGDPIGRAALPLEGSQPRAAREPRIMDKPKVNFECAPTMRTDRESWMGRTRDARKEDAIPGQSGWPPRTHRGRVVRPDTLGGKACWAYTSTVPVERSGIRAAHRGLDAPVRRHPFRRLKFGLVNSEN